MALDPYIVDGGSRAMGAIGNQLRQYSADRYQQGQDQQRNMLAQSELARRQAGDQNALAQQDELRQAQEKWSDVQAAKANPSYMPQIIAKWRQEEPRLAQLDDQTLFAKTEALAMQKLGIQQGEDPGAEQQRALELLAAKEGYAVAGDERQAASARELAEVQSSRAYGLADVGHRNRLAEIEAGGIQTRETNAAKPPPAPSAAEQKAVVAARQKKPMLEAAMRRVDRIAAASDALSQGLTGAIADGGKVDQFALFLTKKGAELEQAGGNLVQVLTSLTRVPGIGSQSDLEQRLAMLQIPSSSMPPEVRAKAIDELRLFTADLRDAYALATGDEAPMGGGGGAPAVAGSGRKTIKFGDLPKSR